ncbi:hypothetical protein EXIGLDRAFT_704331 [Exidia glandulosa HHB12029]|uniref:F-box domain-containing protein n=1 Tax=Exidia glandulosa HHB12029 TaxID=1314781 RepID=A0A165KXA8_EXIGL|nr:hypothetical protein EXIGLDRAFT_704331 [Exidia glandulosa HHB12029]
MSPHILYESSPVSMLSDDLLCMIFHEVHDSDERTTRLWNSNVASLLHVCRRWRYLAMHYAPLWDNLIWSTGCSVDSGLILLELSKMAPICADINAVAVSDKPQPSSEDIAAVHSVIRAVMLHLPRLTVLALSWSDEYWDLDVFEPLSTTSTSPPSSLPRLRELRLLHHPPEDPLNVPTLSNLACHDLFQLHLKHVAVKDWASMVGSSTTSVSLTRCTIQHDNFIEFLENTPSLSELRLCSVDVLDIPLYYFSLEMVGHAMRIVSVSHLDENFLWMLQIEDEREYWLNFLQFPWFPRLTELHTIYSGGWSSLTIIGEGGSPNPKIRSVTAAQSPLPLLSTAFSPGPMDNFTRDLRLLSVDITDWCELLYTIRASSGASCKVLEIRLFVNQSLLAPVTDVEPRDYPWQHFSFPRIQKLEIILQGPEPPSEQLTRHLLRAVRPMFLLEPRGILLREAVRVKFVGSHAHCNVLMRIFEKLAEEGNDPDEVMVCQALLRCSAVCAD